MSRAEARLFKRDYYYSSENVIFNPTTTEYSKGSMGFEQYQQDVSSILDKIIYFADGLGLLVPKRVASNGDKLAMAGSFVFAVLVLLSWFGNFNLWGFRNPILVISVIATVALVFIIGFVYCLIGEATFKSGLITPEGEKIAEQLAGYNQVVLANQAGAAYFSEEENPHFSGKKNWLHRKISRT